MQITKKDQLKYRNKRKGKPGLNISESLLQKQCDDYLALKGLYYIRIVDGVWNGLNYVMKELAIKRWYNLLSVVKNVLQALKNRFAGATDNTVLIGLNEKYSLALSLELKSKKGKKHGKQKTVAKKIPVQESRTPEETMGIINQFIKDAEIIKSIIIKNKEK
jgi:hypothetical protein